MIKTEENRLSEVLHSISCIIGDYEAHGENYAYSSDDKKQVLRDIKELLDGVEV